MTEEEAHAWISTHPRTRDRVAALETYVDLLLAETRVQNLIGPSTSDKIWSRHIVDSAQLWDLAPFDSVRAIDIGSGGGLPGLVLAIMGADIVLSEPRRLRAEFLHRCVKALDLRCTVVQQRGKAVHGQFTIGVARAVATVPTLIDAQPEVRHWIFPRGRAAEIEAASAASQFDGMFHVKQSVTSPDSGIIVATDVRRRAQ